VKFALGRLNPVVQPRHEIGFAYPFFPAETDDDLSNTGFGNPFLLRALKCPASARDLEQFRNVGACFWINAEEKILYVRVD
jgi:hypothetical protein